MFENIDKNSLPTLDRLVLEWIATPPLEILNIADEPFINPTDRRLRETIFLAEAEFSNEVTSYRQLVVVTRLCLTLIKEALASGKTINHPKVEALITFAFQLGMNVINAHEDMYVGTCCHTCEGDCLVAVINDYPDPQDVQEAN